LFSHYHTVGAGFFFSCVFDISCSQDLIDAMYAVRQPRLLITAELVMTIIHQHDVQHRLIVLPLNSLYSTAAIRS